MCVRRDNSAEKGTHIAFISFTLSAVMKHASTRQRSASINLYDDISLEDRRAKVPIIVTIFTCKLPLPTKLMHARLFRRRRVESSRDVYIILDRDKAISNPVTTAKMTPD